MFSAALANPTTASHIRVDLHSWQADYLVLRARDLAAARAELDRALAIAPYNSGNLLKLAQLAIVQGRREEARKTLHQVEKLPLQRADRVLLAELRRCLDNGSAGATCVGK